jgi:alpha-1,3-rhamnosyltransferase
MNTVVTVIIVTYNSSDYVIETLNSIVCQTWVDLELIITDDSSKDDTVEKCHEWLSTNGERFVRTNLITNSVNTGIAANCNRGLKDAKGEWIKYCAGDDSLMPNCIEDNMKYLANHPEIKVLFSQVRLYNENFSEKNYIKTIPGQSPDSFFNESITAEGQYRQLLLSDRITFTPASIINREAQLQVGGFNENVRLQEDYPMWVSLTKAGFRLYFMKKETVRYRQHKSATNQMTIDYLIKPNYFRTEVFRREFIYPNLPQDIRLNMRFGWYTSQIFRCDLLNINKKPNRFLLAVLTIYLNPFRYYIYIKKRLNKNLKDNEFYM